MARALRTKPSEHGAKLWDWPLHDKDEGVVEVKEDFRGFQVALDAKAFTSNEISVKVIGDMIEVRMEHDSKQDTVGSVSRSLTRCYRMPDRIDPNSIRSELDGHGNLVIHGTKKRF